MPAGMHVGVPYDATAYIEDAIDEVLTTLGETLLIVIVVIFFFLGSLRSVLIPVVAIPISLVGAVFLISIFVQTVLGFSALSERAIRESIRRLSELTDSRPSGRPAR